MNLTVAGAAVTALSLIREDRRALAWLGGALLALASWVRLWDIGVREPEPYTLPTALVLLAVGLLHLRRHPDASTMTALAPGLGLALVPSLLWVLADPIELRALLLGIACLGLVLAGVQLRWTAPLTLGALVGGCRGGPAGGAVHRRGRPALGADRPGGRRTDPDGSHLGASAPARHGR